MWHHVVTLSADVEVDLWERCLMISNVAPICIVSVYVPSFVFSCFCAFFYVHAALFVRVYLLSFTAENEVRGARMTAGRVIEMLLLSFFFFYFFA